ncbi:CIC11C00000002316 [Sungouiella intermedia]|uniref:CIC11C00000002316 n=1 Tax=Sungouiella intermedia TaxID=45354 RepID=A0A1L0DBY7_9ASCO|nr:CIC11C00000002316 [[Candida] intermedia]
MSEPKAPQVIAVNSAGSRLDARTHEVELNAVLSQDIALDDIATGLSTDQKNSILKRLNLDVLESLDSLPPSALFMLEKIAAIEIDEALTILKEYLVDHGDDVNIPTEDYDFIQQLVDAEGTPLASKKLNSDASSSEKNLVTAYDLPVGEDLETSEFQIFDWPLQVKTEAALIAYHSPYPEVRSVTDPFDDPSLPVETFRVYFLGLIWTAIGSFINQFFAERQPGISLSAAVVQLLLYPSGIACAYILPKWKFKVWRYTIDLNPGPWTHKEQMLATIFFSVSAGHPYVSYNIHVQKLERYYNNQWANWGYQILLILATNFMGFGFAGIMRKFAVYPIRSIWPTILPTLALNKALMQTEKKTSINGWTISRYNFFFVAFTGSFIYFWFPNYLFQALSYFNWMTWIAPQNFTLSLVTGSLYGLGMNPIPTFDWNVINFNYALTIPFFSQLNQYIGSLIAFFTILGVYYTNYYWSGYLPINTSSLFSNTGEYYSVKAIVNDRSLFDKAKYEQVGPPFYSAANLVVYGAFFALYPFSFIYETVTNYKPMWHALKNLGSSFKNFRKSTFDGFDDPQTVMMKRYKEVADWVFLVVLVFSLVFAIICVKVYPAETPVWGIFFALAMNFIFLIPLTAVYSVTGFSFGLNVLVELIVGYALPGNGLALNFIKALGYNVNGQAQTYISDQKMAHYLKIPPRAVFRVQMLSVFISSFISLAVMNFMFTNVDNYCMPGNKQKFTCPLSNVFYSASVLWGVIGPKKVFGGLYPVMEYCFLIGALLAIPCILYKKYMPRRYTKYFQPTLVIGGMLVFAPYNLTYYTGGLYASFAFMLYIKKKYTTWWEKYNYVLSGALDAGVAFSSIIIFFAVQYNDKSISWWGNNVPFLGVEGGEGQQARLNVTELAPEGYFGPRFGHFP